MTQPLRKHWLSLTEGSKMEIILKLNVNAVNVVLSALARAPYGDVADVINAIRDQAAPQVEAASKAAPEPVKED